MMSMSIMTMMKNSIGEIESDEQASQYLLDTLKPGQLIRLAELLMRCRLETGYGDIKIVLAEGIVQNFKLEQSYK